MASIRGKAEIAVAILRRSNVAATSAQILTACPLSSVTKQSELFEALVSPLTASAQEICRTGQSTLLRAYQTVPISKR